MNFSGLSLLFVSCAVAQDEIELMEATMAEKVHHLGANKGMCNNKPLDPYMLIERVSSNTMYNSMLL